jgi:transcriptional regulator with XRE-family HTH domain
MSDDAPSLEALGRAVRQLRQSRRLAQDELAVRTGLHRTYLGGIERGERNPTWKTLATIAAGLGVSMSELVERAEHEAHNGNGP